jgi:hypothetical protein
MSTSPPAIHVSRFFPRIKWITVFVYGVWLLVVLAGLFFIRRYGSNVPYIDDWELVPAVAGAEPLSPSWLWAQHSDHRIPLPKLLLIGLYRVTGNDFRAPLYFNLAALSALALAMIRGARRLRGHTSGADAFFPLSLMGWGGYDFLIWGFLLQLVCSTVLAGIFLLVILRSPLLIRPSDAAVAGLCLVLLPLTGGNGLGLAPALALWLMGAGIYSWRAPTSSGSRWSAAICLAAVAATVIVVCAYFAGHAGVARSASRPLEISRFALQFLSMGFGIVVLSDWPRWWPVWTVGMVGLCLTAVAVLVKSWRRRPQERLRTSGLMLFIGGMVSLALGAGYGRGGFGAEAGLESRYVIVAAPLLLAVYFSWGLSSLSSRAQWALMLLVLALAWPNAMKARELAAHIRAGIRTFERDLAKGMPVDLLAERHAWALFPVDLPGLPKMIANNMRLLSYARIGLFQKLDDPPFRIEYHRVAPDESHQLTWHDGVGQTHQLDAGMTFRLREPRHVLAVRFTWRLLDAPELAPSPRLYWGLKGAGAAEHSDRALARPGTEEMTVLFWVNETIDWFRFEPDIKDVRFALTKIELCLPAEGLAIPAADSAPSRHGQRRREASPTPGFESAVRVPCLFAANGRSAADYGCRCPSGRTANRGLYAPAAGDSP